MQTGRSEGNDNPFDAEKYLPMEKDYALWPCHFYRLAHTTLDSRIRRAAISVALSLAEYLIGLALAASINFAGTYVSTSAVYFLCASFGFFMGRAESLTLQIPSQLQSARLVFDVPDDKFKKEITLLCRRATDRRITIPLTVLAIALAVGVIADYYFGLEPVIVPYVAALVAPSFPAAWHVGSNVVIKMLILDMYVGLSLVLIVPVLYAGGVVLIRAPFLAKRWRVLPMPSYLVTALQPLSDYMWLASIYFAMGVFTIVALYAPRTDRVFLAAIMFFSLLGALGMLVPYLWLGLLLGKARQRLVMDVAANYYRDIRPIGGRTDGVPDDPSGEQQYIRYRRLFQLEELMHQAIQPAGRVQQLHYLVGGIVIQLAPTLLALIIVAISAPHQLLSIFIH